MLQPLKTRHLEPFESAADVMRALYGLGFRTYLSIFEGWRRIIVDLGDERLVHGALRHRNPGLAQADLEAEGRVLAAIHPHMSQIGIETPCVLETFRCVSSAGDPPRLLQVRTKVGGPTCLEVEGSRTFDPQALARSVGESIAHLHTASIAPLFPAPGDADPRGNVNLLPEDDESEIEKGRITRDVQGIFASVRDHFNDLTRNTPRVFLHNDLAFRNLCVDRITSSLTGIFDFELAYAGVAAGDFVHIGLANAKCPINPLLRAYNRETSSRLPPITRSDIACMNVVRMYGWVRNRCSADHPLLTDTLRAYVLIRDDEEEARSFVSLPASPAVKAPARATAGP